MRRALVLVALISQAGCVPAPQEAATPEAAIAQVVARRHTAMASQDLAGFRATIDEDRPVFRRCQLESFEIAGRQGEGGRPAVLKVEPYAHGYLRAYVGESGTYVRRYFREVEGRWVMSEPRLAELGAEGVKQVEGMELRYWAIDEDVVGAVGHVVVESALFALQHAPGEVGRAFTTKLYPTSESLGDFAPCPNVLLGTYAAFPSPAVNLYRIEFDDRLALAPSVGAVMRHEALHWIQEQTTSGSGGVAWWLSEGWPDMVSGTTSRQQIAAAVCTTAIPTYKQLVDDPPAGAGIPVELAGRYYAYANAMVEYLHDLRGADAYWALYRAYRTSGFRVPFQASDLVLRNVLGTTQEAFQASWVGFAKKKYC